MSNNEKNNNKNNTYYSYGLIDIILSEPIFDLILHVIEKL